MSTNSNVYQCQLKKYKNSDAPKHFFYETDSYHFQIRLLLLTAVSKTVNTPTPGS